MAGREVFLDGFDPHPASDNNYNGMKENVESRTAETILQKPFVVRAGGKEYEVARPTPATLIEVSALVRRMGDPGRMRKSDIVPYSLSVADRDYPLLLRVAATLIVGVRKPGRAAWLKWPFHRDERKRIEDELRYGASPRELTEIVTSCLSFQDIGFFLSTIISLKEINVTRPTRKGATVSGE